MNDEKLRKQIGANIVSYRKHFHLTQAGLAEKLNYSDKAVSKWERGESVPDVMTLMQIADLFEISVNDLLVDPNELPEDKGKVSMVVEKALKRKANKNIVLMLCSLLVWFVVFLVFAILSTVGIERSWLGFVYAIPTNAIVALSLRSAWHDFRWNQFLVSAIVWGFTVSIFVSLLVFWKILFWQIFLLGLLGQLAVLLWFRMFHTSKKEPKEEHGESRQE